MNIVLFSLAVMMIVAIALILLVVVCAVNFLGKLYDELQEARR